MMEFLQRLLGMEPAHSEMPAPETFSTQQEQHARANGFPSAAAMMAWSRQRVAPHQGTVTAPANPEGGPTIAGAQPMAMHPANIFRHIMGEWNRATGE